MDNINNAPDTTNVESATVEQDDFLSVFGGNAADTAAGQTETEADQPKETEKPEEDNGKDYTIRYKGKDEVLHLTDDQLTAYLQKGRDYDEVRKQRDELSTKSADFETLNRMADYFASNNGMTRKEYIDYFNSQTSEDGIRAKIDEDYPDASDELKQELFESRKAKMSAAKEAALEEETAKDMTALYAEYPDAPKDINEFPSDVQADIENGMKPVEAWRLHELRELRKTKQELDTQIAALQKEKDNHYRSTGRAESKAPSVAADPFISVFTGGG